MTLRPPVKALERLHEDHQTEDAVHDARHAGEVADVEWMKRVNRLSASRTPRGRSPRRSDREGEDTTNTPMMSEPHRPCRTPTARGWTRASPVRKPTPRWSKHGPSPCYDVCHSSDDQDQQARAAGDEERAPLGTPCRATSRLPPVKPAPTDRRRVPHEDPAPSRVIEAISIRSGPAHEARRRSG